MLSPGASSTSVFESIAIEGYEGAPMLDDRAIFDIAFSRFEQVFRESSAKMSPNLKPLQDAYDTARKKP
jgi:hypothetical protein